MDCANFDRRLAALLGDEIDSDRRADELLALRRHTEQCPDCEGANDLIEIAAPASARLDLAEPPPEGYWDGFQQRLRTRIEAEPRRGARRWLAVAALLVVVLAGSWALRRGVVPAVSPDPARPVAGLDDESGAGLPTELDELLSQVPPDEALRQLEFLEGLGGAWIPASPEAIAEEVAEEPNGGDWIYPDTGSLNDEARRELLEWLRRESATDRRTRS